MWSMIPSALFPPHCQLKCREKSPSPRQTGCGGSANGGCDYLRVYGMCATIEKVPCLEAHIDAETGALSGMDAAAQVVEDGVKACATSIHCALWDGKCNGPGEKVDWGNVNRMTWTWSFISYYNSTK